MSADSPDRSGFVYFSNRGSRIFQAALTPLGGRPYKEGDAHIDLLYFDQYSGGEPPQEPSVGFSLIDRERTIPLDNKGRMAEMLLAAGIDYPRVFFSEEAVPREPDTLWYVKDPLTTAGKGIAVVTREGIAACFRPGYIIQEAVQDLALIENRKFTLRLYVLVNRGVLFLYPSGIVVLHGAEYDPASVDPLVQYRHSGYMEAGSPVRMMLFSEFADSERVIRKLRAYLLEVFAAFRNLLVYEKAHAYCLFGVDLLVRSDLSPVLVEINDRPNIVHTRIINEAVNVPMIRSLCCILCPSCQDPLAAREQAGFDAIADL